MKPTTYSCQIVRTPSCVGDRDRREADGPPEVAGDEDRPAAQAVDPDARRQAEQDERQELDRAEQGDLEGADLEEQDGDERDRQQADLGAELADRLGRPQLEEVGVAQEAPARRPPAQGSGCSLALQDGCRAAASTRRAEASCESIV